jgi:hypothetical protein
MQCLIGYQVALTGQLVAGPAGSSGNSFPAGSSQIPFATNPDPKPANVSTGDVQVNVSAQSYAALAGVGAGGAVTQGTLLFFRCNSPMQLRTTTYNSGGNVQAVEVVNGLKIVEFDQGAYLVLLEVIGSGPVEYFVSGPQ